MHSLALFDKNCLNPNDKEIDKFTIYSEDSIYYVSIVPTEANQIGNIRKSYNFNNSQFIKSENYEKENNESINGINNKNEEKDKINNEKSGDKGNNIENSEENNVLQEVKFEEVNKINIGDSYQQNKLNDNSL